ncbi:hypothetical protein I7I51_00403 [Histoplasma capsulatum]|uniref:Uncharacterized protein n=1 Tax=Ajellomyces capsulatus TaxID=5037 RepID=A0A8A1MA07_AJECA|nr:predicted protein [Histoplasma mississippiense (nom. inval.)]EDN08752.1 predicted protein [Histoplasma mississippiense (nom. inval.)]QSS63346.1 hypothetical protein I7I51_00403 [Histoplasma capsulatum]
MTRCGEAGDHDEGMWADRTEKIWFMSYLPLFLRETKPDLDSKSKSENNKKRQRENRQPPWEMMICSRRRAGGRTIPNRTSPHPVLNRLTPLDREEQSNCRLRHANNRTEQQAQSNHA